LNHQCRKEGNALEVETAGTRERFSTRLRGRGNVHNALAAIAFAWKEGIPAGPVRNGLEKVETVPGRFEFVNEGQPYEVIVDYAHTHHALNNLLDSVQDLKPARIILVFGCGGDRDRSKRPLMGKVAVQKADLVIITSDNPRSEEPLSIISDIERGIPFWLRKKYVVLADRKAAIQEAISFGRPQDCVVIAGKGHETYQILKNTIIPFDDREEARRAIRERPK
jgi:UDP-N-acetylmuramyl-tripeptide synthetase